MTRTVWPAAGARLVVLALTILAMAGLSLHIPAEAGARSADPVGMHTSDHAAAGHGQPDHRHAADDPAFCCSSIVGHCSPAYTATAPCSLGPATARYAKILMASVQFTGFSPGVEPPPPRI